MTRRLRFVVVASVAAFASTSAFAQNANPDFVTVDAIGVAGNRLTITGIVEGGATAVSRTLSFTETSSGVTIGEQLQACKELAYVAMSKPGQYRLRAYNGYPSSCGLVRVNP
jgi:hypothetical protein